MNKKRGFLSKYVTKLINNITQLDEWSFASTETLKLFRKDINQNIHELDYDYDRNNKLVIAKEIHAVINELITLHDKLQRLVRSIK